jgi:hypothetical protein
VIGNGTCSTWLSIFGNNATGVRAGSGTLPLLLDVTAVVFTMSGQSAIPLGAVVSVSPGTDGCADCCGCATCFGFVQQLCATAGSQVSPSTTVALESISGNPTVSAPIACMLQPNRHPPAIHIDTITASRTRGNLMNRTDFTGSSLLLKTQKYKDLASVM